MQAAIIGIVPMMSHNNAETPIGTIASGLAYLLGKKIMIAPRVKTNMTPIEYMVLDIIFISFDINSPIKTVSDTIIFINPSLCPSCSSRANFVGDVPSVWNSWVRGKMEDQGVKVFSSNYTLYADMSARMNLIYNRYAPEVEAYSIDESYLFFPGWVNADFSEIALDIKQAVKTVINTLDFVSENSYMIDKRL